MTNLAPRLGVSTCVLRGGEVLLVERANAPYAGALSLPGGRVEFGETLAGAAARELREETGLTIRPLVFERFLEAIEPDFHVVIAVHHADCPPGAEPKAGDDALRTLFVPVGDLARLEAEGRTTPGLAGIVRSIADAPRS